MAAPAVRRAIGLEYFTLGWNTFEAGVAMVSGVVAASVALTAFGVDSAIELASATVVLVRLRALVAGGEPDEERERRALRVVAVCFFVLAVYVAADAAFTLARAEHPTSSPAGIAVSAAAIVVMTALARAKRRTADRLDAEHHGGVAALVRADGAETALCSVLAVSTLVGLTLNAAVGWWWADPVVSLVVVYFAIREGREAWAGEAFCDDD